MVLLLIFLVALKRAGCCQKCVSHKFREQLAWEARTFLAGGQRGGCSPHHAPICTNRHFRRVTDQKLGGQFAGPVQGVGAMSNGMTHVGVPNKNNPHGKVVLIFARINTGTIGILVVKGRRLRGRGARAPMTGVDSGRGSGQTKQNISHAPCAATVKNKLVQQGAAHNIYSNHTSNKITRVYNARSS